MKCMSGGDASEPKHESDAAGKSTTAAAESTVAAAAESAIPIVESAVSVGESAISEAASAPLATESAASDLPAKRVKTSQDWPRSGAKSIGTGCVVWHPAS